MKKVIIISLLFMLNGTAALALGNGNQNSFGNPPVDETDQVGQMNQETTQNSLEQGEVVVQDKLSEEQIMKETMEMEMERERERERVREAREIIARNRLEMEGEKDLQVIQQRRNEVATTVRSLLEIKDVLGGIGPQVSEIATEFNNSVQATIQAEEKIKNRNSLLKFFTGNDQETLKEMEKEVNKNQERIQQMIQLREVCDCGEEVKNFFQEQTEKLQQEQNQLRETVQKEKQVKGLFERLFGWLKGTESEL